jgi:hydroxysqualene synthase
MKTATQEQPPRIASPPHIPYIGAEMTPLTETDAFAACEAVARAHYENFPVASLLIPRTYRRYVAAVYAFARTADDFADEGDHPPEERLRLLDDWEGRLRACYNGSADHPVFVALRATVRKTGLPQEQLQALLRAFRMDVTKKRYPTFDELLEYCTNSANPVGRLVLHIFGASNSEMLSLSDRLCTALQLTNFWQDIVPDFARGRLYVPLEDLRRFGYTEEDLAAGVADDRFRALLRFEVERTRCLFAAGAPLLRDVRGRLRMELAATLQGGQAILEAIEEEGYDTLHRRPVLRLKDKLMMMWEALASQCS